jgi:hypothetical protein
MAGNHYSDVVGLRIGNSMVCMGCVTTLLLRDAREEDLFREKDIQENGIRCIRCERWFGANGKAREVSILKRPDVSGQRRKPNSRSKVQDSRLKRHGFQIESGMTKRTTGFLLGLRNDGRWTSKAQGKEGNALQLEVRIGRVGAGKPHLHPPLLFADFQTGDDQIVCNQFIPGPVTILILFELRSAIITVGFAWQHAYVGLGSADTFSS